MIFKDDKMQNTESSFCCGTLTYTKWGIITLFCWMLWGDFCFTMMESLVPTLMPILLRQHNASNLTIGLLVGSIPAVLNFIINPIVSTASDRTRTRWGRRIPYLLFTSPFVVLFLILVGWSDVIGAYFYRLAYGDGGNPAFVIISMIAIFGVGFQLFDLFVASVFFYIFADVVPKPLMGRFMACFRIVGTAAGVVFQKYILPMADVKEYIPWIFTGVAMVYLFSFIVMCLRVKEGSYPSPEKIERASVFRMIRKYTQECFSIPFYLLLFIGLSINVTSNICRIMFNLLFAKEELGLTMAQYGHVMAVINVIMLFAYIPLGWIVDRFHPLRIFIVGGVLIIAANIIGFFFCNGYTSFFVVSFLVSATYVLQGASGLPLTVRLYPSEKYGQFCSARSMVTSVFEIIANAGGGAFIDCFGYRYIFVWDFIFTIIATALLLVVYRQWKQNGGDASFVPPQKNVRI